VFAKCADILLTIKSYHRNNTDTSTMQTSYNGTAEYCIVQPVSIFVTFHKFLAAILIEFSEWTSLCYNCSIGVITTTSYKQVTLNTAESVAMTAGQPE